MAMHSNVFDKEYLALKPADASRFSYFRRIPIPVGGMHEITTKFCSLVQLGLSKCRWSDTGVPIPAAVLTEYQAPMTTNLDSRISDLIETMNNFKINYSWCNIVFLFYSKIWDLRTVPTGTNTGPNQ